MNFTRKILGSLLIAGAFALIGCGDPVSAAAPLVTGEHGITAIAVDDFFVYWASQDGSVKRVSRDGGKAETLVSNDQPTGELAVDDKHVYWLASDGAISRTAKADGTTEALVKAGHASTLVIDPTHIYFTSIDGTIQQRSKEDGSTTDLAPNQKPSSRLALNGTTLLWADQIKSNVNETLTNSGSTDALVAKQSAPDLVAISSSSIYWSNTGDNTVGVAQRDGTDVHLIPALSSSFTSAVMGDDAFVYFGDLSGGVNIASVHGGEATQLAQGPMGKVVMAMDASSIYWAHSSGGTIFTAPRQ